MRKRNKGVEDGCRLCGREVALTFHHLIPKKMHRRTHFKKHFNKEELNRGLNICRLCHQGIHAAYDEMRLAKDFHTVEALQQDNQLRTHFAWVSKQKV